LNILAIAAHPDDLEICCYGTFSKYKKQGHNIFAALVTRGNMGSNKYGPDEIAAIRKSEQEASAKILGLPIRFLGFPELLTDCGEVRAAIMDAIRWAEADVIFTHYPQDNSMDHGLTGTIVKQIVIYAAWKNFKTEHPPVDKAIGLFYWDTNGGVGFLPEAYVDVTEEMPLKREALSRHKSQTEQVDDYDYERLMEYTAGFRGVQSGYKYAEAFAGFRVFTNIADFRLLP